MSELSPSPQPEQQPVVPEGFTGIDPGTQALLDMLPTLEVNLPPEPESAAGPGAPAAAMSLSAEAARQSRLRARSRLGLPIRLSETTPQIRDEILADMFPLQRAAAECMPSNEVGLDVPRIDEFFMRQGLPTKPVTVLTPENFSVYAKQLKKFGFSNSSFESLGRMGANKVRSLAQFIPSLDRVVALRPPGRLTKEQIYALTYTIVHEKAYTTGLSQGIVYVENEDGTRNLRGTRHGFTFPENMSGNGSYLEEGYAELVATEYVRQELGLPNGMWEGQTMVLRYGYLIWSLYRLFMRFLLTGAKLTAVAP